MNVQIIVTLPETTYQQLQEIAAQKGQSPENYLATTAEEAIAKNKPPTQEGDPFKDDPFFQLSGFIHSGIAIPADRYDEYLAEEIADDHNDEP